MELVVDRAGSFRVRVASIKVSIFNLDMPRSTLLQEDVLSSFIVRLRIVSNFGDGDCGTGEIHMHAREISRRREAKGVFRPPHNRHRQN